HHRADLRFLRSGRRYDDADAFDHGAGIWTEDGGGHQCVYYDFLGADRGGEPFCPQRASPDGSVDSVYGVYLLLGEDRDQNRHRSGWEDAEPYRGDLSDGAGYPIAYHHLLTFSFFNGMFIPTLNREDGIKNER